MMEHFSHGNPYSLCYNEDPEEILKHFNAEDCENLRKIFSFRDLVEKETSKNGTKLLTDDVYLKTVVAQKIHSLKEYRYYLFLFIKSLYVLVSDLPGTPLGKQIRELYATATTETICETSYFDECFKLLNFQSKDEFCDKLKKVIEIIENNQSTKMKSNKELKEIIKKLEDYLEEFTIVGTKVTETNEDKTEEAIAPIENISNRKKFMETLKSMSNSSKKNDYEKLREKVLDYLRGVFQKYLVHYSNFHFHEIFFFNDTLIQNRIIGTNRSAIHTALQNPQVYLQCSCCEIENESVILPTMPDISIAYKLHLECGKMINLYDWLQAFLSILNPSGNDDGKKKIDPELQARFTQAVVELEYLGFIKTSKRKTDHVQRLTWGG